MDMRVSSSPLLLVLFAAVAVVGMAGCSKHVECTVSSLKPANCKVAPDRPASSEVALVRIHEGGNCSFLDQTVKCPDIGGAVRARFADVNPKVAVCVLREARHEEAGRAIASLHEHSFIIHFECPEGE